MGDAAAFLADAARAGLGIAMLHWWYGDAGVREGTLAPVLPRFSSETALHVLTHQSRHLPRRVVLVRDFLADRLVQTCAERARSHAA